MFNKKQLIFSILRILAKAGIAVVVAAVVVGFSSRQISKISDSLAEQRAAVFTLERRNETVSQIREDFKIIGNADAKIEAAFPSRDNIIEFVTALERTASQNAVQQSLSFGVPVNNSIDYGINLTANINTLINYLKTFEKLSYFTAVSSVNLSASSAGWESNSSISMRAKVYAK